MNIALNGEMRATSALNVRELLEANGIDPGQQGVAVAINERVVRRAVWEQTMLRDGDRVEIITAMQGG